MQTQSISGILSLVFLVAGGAAAAADEATPLRMPAGYIIGADISRVPQLEAGGVKFSENG